MVYRIRQNIVELSLDGGKAKDFYLTSTACSRLFR